MPRDRAVSKDEAIVGSVKELKALPVTIRKAVMEREYYGIERFTRHENGDGWVSDAIMVPKTIKIGAEAVLSGARSSVCNDSTIVAVAGRGKITGTVKIVRPYDEGTGTDTD